MKTIQLTRGMVAVVDDYDYDFLRRFSWTVQHSNGRNWYASREIDGKTILMHRYMMSVGDSSDKIVMHIDNDGLNNQRSNLRIVTRSEANHSPRRALGRNNTTGYRGVSYDKARGKYKSRINVDGMEIALGRFTTAEEASAAYLEAAGYFYGKVLV